MKTTTLFKLLLLQAAMAIVPAASAQDFPTRPVRLVVAFGGGAAGLVHVLAERLKVELGQPVVVDQVPAAGGVIAATTVARAAPDGYTLLVGTATALVARPLVMKDKPYDPVGDFTPISQMSTPAFGLAVNPRLGIT
jgi:tripartite-type tricarboxylate transporter receptor subunit TctC